MILDTAIRLSEILLAFAYVLQSIEFMRGLQPEKSYAVVRLFLSLLLLVGIEPVLTEAGLLIIACLLLQRFQGPYNGGSDCMSILVLLCLFLSHIAPNHFWQEMALGYLAFQLTFSYFQSGYIKIINADWRSGQALADVFALTAYPVSENLRHWAQSRRLMQTMSWSVMLFELAFPLAFFNHATLLVALGIAAVFHLANAFLFGLNRFFWIWPAAYPVIIGFQHRVFLQ